MFSLIDEKTVCASDIFKHSVGGKSGQHIHFCGARHVENGLYCE